MSSSASTELLGSSAASGNEEQLAVRLSDRYERSLGRVYLTGIQALARVPLDRARIDRGQGKSIGTYISGYEGSPLAGYDMELQRQTSLLETHDITFEPALNEEAAAMAVQGTQLIGELDSRVDGVVGFWYGKAPGLDRASDALRHANLMGTHPQGGVVALVGDDPGAKSSSVPCASERTLEDLGMPTLYPADPGEILTLGRHAVALSRASGLWSALKVVTAVADGSASVDLTTHVPDPVLPMGSGRHAPTAKLLQPTLGPLERDFMTTRMRIAKDYARLNSLNPLVSPAPSARVGVVTAGKTFLDVQEALRRLGLATEDESSGRIRLLKLGMIWPLDDAAVREFAAGLSEVIVVEEKRSFIESMVRDALYGLDSPPTVSGKTSPDGSELFAAYGELDTDSVALGLARRLKDRAEYPSVAEWMSERSTALSRHRLHLPLAQRSPYYCSGCPHNTSTRPHTDSLVGAGIGCHAMVLLMDSKQVGHVMGLTQMGGEGMQWLGMAPFVSAPHLVQNLGDGTFHHSGSLAIRAAVASGQNITYRILYNSTVAMTGGQDAVGQMTVPAMVKHLQAEGVSRIIVSTDDKKAMRRARLPKGVKIVDRSEIAAAERALASTPGTTILIHEQECATELRRKRKRGQRPMPVEAIVINERLCEGCGDCGEKSNCLSVHPVDTEFGRKTRIHQSSCNADRTCLAGDCPAFMTVKAGQRVASSSEVPPLEAVHLPEPPSRERRDQCVRLMGIGGTGVVTTSQVLATAAFLAGLHVRTLDQTGLAQKGGAVVSDVKFTARDVDISNKIGERGCDLYLGFDVLVAADPRNVTVLAGDGNVVVSTSAVPTGAMISDKSVAFPDTHDALAPLVDRVGPDRIITVDARAYAEALFGAEQFANMILLGIAHQSGALTLAATVIEAAIGLNGVAVQRNIQAFRRGRQFVSDPVALEAVVASTTASVTSPSSQPSMVVHAPSDSELERIVRVRRHELRAYQNENYATGYEEFVEAVRRAESQVDAGSTALSESVARFAYKLMAYKDEYEVARLALDPRVHAEVSAQFGEDARVQWRLHPPTLRGLGLKRKLALGRPFAPVLVALYWLRFLRGSPLDPFGHAKVRRLERHLATKYEQTIRQCLPRLTRENLADVIRLAELPDQVRGYEDIKLRTVEAYEAERERLLTDLL